MATPKITQQMLEAEAEGDADDTLETKFFAPLFDREIDLTVYYDDGRNAISPRQLEAVNQFAAITEGIDLIAEQLYQQWWNNSDSFEFECEDAQHALANAELQYLFINSEGYWGPARCSMLRYRPQWDEEHGAGVFVVNGQISRFGDPFERPIWVYDEKA